MLQATEATLAIRNATTWTRRGAGMLIPRVKAKSGSSEFCT
jgi:hypothetical protein